MLDFLTFALCVPYCETTDGKDLDNFLELVAARGRALFRLFQVVNCNGGVFKNKRSCCLSWIYLKHTSLAVVKGAGLVMRALIEEGDAVVAAKMQNLALSEGALPRHLLTALFTQASDGRLLAHRQLSRHLIGLWVTEHSTTMELLKRILVRLSSYLCCVSCGREMKSYNEILFLLPTFYYQYETAFERISYWCVSICFSPTDCWLFSILQKKFLNQFWTKKDCKSETI